MSDKPAAENAAGASSAPNVSASNTSAGSAPKGPAAAAEGNPAFRAMGLPRLRARLPSRNWMIFLGITGSFASAIFYDKYQTRRARQKWCDLVSHIADEPLPAHQMPRKVTVYLSAPPGDGLRYAREHFHEYVKPVLVAAGVDWDSIEGRKEGDVRYRTAEKIRKKRRKAGEGELGEGLEGEVMVEEQRKNNGTREWDGVAGDIVVGRTAWKEYIRGVHEGWLGPVNAPKAVEEETASSEKSTSAAQSTAGAAALESAGLAPSDDNLQQPLVPEPQPQGAEEKKEEKKEEEKPKPRQPPPYIQPSEFDTATSSPHTPEIIGPSVGVRMPHILGFRHTPLRIYRFLNRRHLADSVGRDVASAVLASYRSYDTVPAPERDDSSASSNESRDLCEATRVLDHEEEDWYKLVRKDREPHEESVWIEEIKMDERLAGRMRAFQLTAEDEDRAKRIAEGKEKVGKEVEDEG